MSNLKTLAIIGSGDLGQQIAHYALSDNHYGKVVFIDDFAVESQKNGIKIIGKSADIAALFLQKKFDEVIIGIGYFHLAKKKELFEALRGKIPFGKIIHSRSWVDPTATISEGCIVYPSCSIDIRAQIHENTILNNGCTIAHDSIVGAHSFLSPRAALAGFVKIGEMAIVGTNATIIDNIAICPEVQLGAGTVVTKNIIQKGLYVGNPYRFIR